MDVLACSCISAPSANRVTHLFQNTGSSRSPGTTRNAGNVIRLNTPNTPTIPSTVADKTHDRCCVSNLKSADSLISGNGVQVTYPWISDSLDQNETPRNNERLYRVGERVRLIGPGHVGRGDEENGDTAMLR